MTSNSTTFKSEQDNLPKARHLTKSWRNRQLGGICAGLAAYLGLNAWTVRILLMIIISKSSDINLRHAKITLGNAIIIGYLFLYFVLFWDDSGKPRKESFWSPRI